MNLSHDTLRDLCMVCLCAALVFLCGPMLHVSPRHRLPFAFTCAAIVFLALLFSGR